MTLNYTQTWEQDDRVLHNGERLKIGKWFVGEVCYESRSKAAHDNYAAKSTLPGLKETLDYYPTMEAAKARVEQATGFWLAKLGIQAVTVQERPPLNDETRFILGRPTYWCGHIARVLRKLGHEIPEKAEEEQAYVIHLMLTYYGKHGDSWRKVLEDYLGGVR